MIERPDLVEEFENARIRSEPPDYERALRIVESLYEEARALGAFPREEPLEGIEVDLKVAKALNVPADP